MAAPCGLWVVGEAAKFRQDDAVKFAIKSFAINLIINAVLD